MSPANIKTTTRAKVSVEARDVKACIVGRYKIGSDTSQSLNLGPASVSTSSSISDRARFDMRYRGRDEAEWTGTCSRRLVQGKVTWVMSIGPIHLPLSHIMCLGHSMDKSIKAWLPSRQKVMHCVIATEREYIRVHAKVTWLEFGKLCMRSLHQRFVKI